MLTNERVLYMRAASRNLRARHWLRVPAAAIMPSIDLSLAVAANKTLEKNENNIATLTTDGLFLGLRSK